MGRRNSRRWAKNLRVTGDIRHDQAQQVGVGELPRQEKQRVGGLRKRAVDLPRCIEPRHLRAIRGYTGTRWVNQGTQNRVSSRRTRTRRGKTLEAHGAKSQGTGLFVLRSRRAQNALEEIPHRSQPRSPGLYRQARGKPCSRTPERPAGQRSAEDSVPVLFSTGQKFQ